MTPATQDFVNRLMALWRGPLPEGAAAEAAFAECYADEVVVNGDTMSHADLVARARALHASFSDIRSEVLDVVEAPGRVVVAFLMHVRHTGPLATPSGTLAATGRTAAARTIDVLTVQDGRITAIAVVSDQLGLLTELGAFPAS